MELAAVPDLSDVARMIAIDQLRSAGQSIEVGHYRDNSMAIEALVTGKLDIASLPFPQTLAAIQQGASIATLMEGGVLSRTLVAAPEVTTCNDLDGREVSVPNLVSAQALSVQRYFRRHCPDAKIGLLVINGVDNRLAAFLTRRTGAALLDTMSQLKLERTPNAPFTMLAELGVEFPGISGATIVASKTFLRAYPDSARDVVRELLLAVRRLQDPEVFRAELQRRLEFDPVEADGVARLSIRQKMWDMNGGLSDEAVKGNIDFAREAGVLQQDLDPALVVDRSFVEAALQEIGRK